jgi:hypothetical protein
VIGLSTACEGAKETDKTELTYSAAGMIEGLVLMTGLEVMDTSMGSKGSHCCTSVPLNCARIVATPVTAALGAEHEFLRGEAAGGEDQRGWIA